MVSRFGKTKVALITASSIVALGLLSSCGSDKTKSTVFEVNIENRSPANLGYVSALTNGVFLVHTSDSPVFKLGQALPNNGFESYAEDANATKIIDSIGFEDNVTLTGVVDSSKTGTQGTLVPGENYRFVVVASDKDSRLSAYLKFLEANDVFLGTNPMGIPLFNAAGAPLSGDVTSEFTFFDAGTEVNEKPGSGANQLIRQGSENTGTTENGLVRPVNDGFNYPPVSPSFRVTINVLDEVES